MSSNSRSRYDESPMQLLRSTRSTLAPGAPIALGALATLAIGCSEPAPPARPAPEHIVLIVIDTLRADHLGVLGHDKTTSPVLDALAERGVVFERATSQCSWTAPSMVSLMTGRWIAGDRLDVPLEGEERLPTIATSFEAAGWSTAAFIYNDIVSEANGYRGGFDVFEQHVPYEPMDPIVDWIGQHAHEPSFLYVHLNEPHDPYWPPEEHRQWVLAPPQIDGGERSFFESVRAEYNLPAIAESVSTIEHERAGYVDDVRFSDGQVGAIVDALERNGLLDKTAIVVTADHGEGLWTRVAYASGDRAAATKNGQAPTLENTLKMTHGNQLYSELVHVPLLVSAPGIAGGARIAERVENVDIWPTLLELCDLPAPGALDGTSLLEAIDQPEDWVELKSLVFSATRYATTVITQDDWQLILPAETGLCLEGLTVELYDLSKDPLARKNLATDHPERVSELTRLARERQARSLPDGITAAVLAANADVLADLGYVDVIVDNPDLFRDLGTTELLGLFEDQSWLACERRLKAAKALRERRASLDEQALRTVEALLETESSPAVRDEFEATLGG